MHVYNTFTATIKLYDSRHLTLNLSRRSNIIIHKFRQRSAAHRYGTINVVCSISVLGVFVGIQKQQKAHVALLKGFEFKSNDQKMISMCKNYAAYIVVRTPLILLRTICACHELCF